MDQASALQAVMNSIMGIDGQKSEQQQPNQAPSQLGGIMQQLEGMLQQATGGVAQQQQQQQAPGPQQQLAQMLSGIFGMASQQQGQQQQQPFGAMNMNVFQPVTAPVDTTNNKSGTGAVGFMGGNMLPNFAPPAQGMTTAQQQQPISPGQQVLSQYQMPQAKTQQEVELQEALKKQRNEQNQMEAISDLLRKEQAKSHHELQMQIDEAARLEQEELARQRQRAKGGKPPKPSHGKKEKSKKKRSKDASAGLLMLAGQQTENQSQGVSSDTSGMTSSGDSDGSAKGKNIKAKGGEKTDKAPPPLQGTANLAGPKQSPTKSNVAASGAGGLVVPTGDSQHVPRFVTVRQQNNHETSEAAAAASAAVFVQRKRERGRPGVFPQKIHQMLGDLERLGMDDIASFIPGSNTMWAIHKNKEFVNCVMPTYFNTNNFASFQRQLNMYNFKRVLEEGPERGAYYHEHFIRNQPLLSTKIKRKRGGKKTAAAAAGSAPSPAPTPSAVKSTPARATTTQAEAKAGSITASSKSNSEDKRKHKHTKKAPPPSTPAQITSSSDSNSSKQQKGSGTSDSNSNSSKPDGSSDSAAKEGGSSDDVKSSGSSSIEADKFRARSSKHRSERSAHGPKSAKDVVESSTNTSSLSNTGEESSSS